MKVVLNLITYNNGYGLTRDLQLFATLIKKHLPKGVYMIETQDEDQKVSRTKIVKV